MVGIDLCKKTRFKNIEKHTLEKILHKKEFELLASEQDKDHFIATRWAIKEALYKCNNEFFEFSKICIIKQTCGRYEFLDNSLKKFVISTSSEDDYIIAIVMQEGK
ncbi:4'-phosphopantetheinyl transferase superfamily protein [Metamycoplasma hyosynoviae]|uniref:Holo-[acyl-carrier protein] synthase n=1 Tax=Metamycoplasma hyosynoviae TaxID=29559 RepID=A0A063YCL3_9BACT|nr:4'-phosphopantetheinyl transferase superfamily protein [Metamycoplasma hyosynoviae]ASI54126.1 hypothetical protein MHSN_03030 [Metamycoplasma hyosynoviae]KDE42007.1 peptide transporter [Metamycoplasma hyosynoviae]KDE42470.1 peptide transporter [Metamycoplasma hyosynoviae]KDE42605.1 peptide transporter [Metamycoplasma hyosynoviae]KDE43080.1 peptide transporter [Metamycoplasma hyosynoviae]